MLEETPAWTFTSERSLIKWFECVRLLSSRGADRYHGFVNQRTSKRSHLDDGRL